MKFIRKKDRPSNRTRDVTYRSFLCKVRNKNKEKNGTHLTVGGDHINYPGEVATPTAKMLVISMKGARFMTGNLSNFYLNTPLKRPECWLNLVTRALISCA